MMMMGGGCTYSNKVVRGEEGPGPYSVSSKRHNPFFRSSEEVIILSPSSVDECELERERQREGER